MKVSRHRLTLKTSKAEIQEERIGKIDREKGKGFYVTPARMNSKEMFREVGARILVMRKTRQTFHSGPITFSDISEREREFPCQFSYP